MNLPINKAEVLRYAGYRRKFTLSPELDGMVDAEMAAVQTIAKPRYTWHIFDLDAQTENVIKVIGTDLVLPGHDIYQHLKHAQKVALLAATLGIEVERHTRQLEITAMTRAYLFDACCVDLIEKVCDLAQVVLAEEIADQGLVQNRRYSPGYGDLPLAVQPQFLQAVDANKTVGIQLTDSYLMIPRKSVTALVGLFEDAQQAKPKYRQPTDFTPAMLQSVPRK
ncbi:MAG: methionine synthase [Lactobacillaceae bacterium]|jgi:hypothetical protein|nr:methionine synthase [Lactobacillaceae bacterium]